MGSASGKYKTAGGDSNAPEVNISSGKPSSAESPDKGLNADQRDKIATETASTVGMTTGTGLLGREEVADKLPGADDVTAETSKVKVKKPIKKRLMGMVNSVTSKILPRRSKDSVLDTGTTKEMPVVQDNEVGEAVPESADEPRKKLTQEHQGPYESTAGLPEYDLASGLLTNMNTNTKKPNRRISFSNDGIPTVDAEHEPVGAVRRSESDRVSLKSSAREEDGELRPAAVEPQATEDLVQLKGDDVQVPDPELNSPMAPQSHNDDLIDDSWIDELCENDKELMPSKAPSPCEVVEPVPSINPEMYPSTVFVKEYESINAIGEADLVAEGVASGLDPDECPGGSSSNTATAKSSLEFTPAEGDGPTRLHTKIRHDARGDTGRDKPKRGQTGITEIDI